MTINFIVNPTSGRGRGEKTIKIIENELADRNINFDIQTTTPTKSGIDLAKETVKAGYSKVVAVGGDGTLNEVVNGILHSKPPYPKLGLIPAGTGNNFARGLGMPLNLKKACRQILDSSEMKIDVGRVNDRFFLNSLGIGINSKVVAEANQNFKHLQGAIVYILAALKVMPDYQSINLEITLETGEKLKGRYFLLVIGNSKIYSTALELIPEFDINDGLLDLCLVKDMSKAELMAKSPYFLLKRHRELDEVLIKKVKGAKIKLENSREFHVDGEMLKEDNILEVSISPRALSLLI